MEQLWKDITLSNIPHEVFPPPPSIHHSRPTADAPFSGIILQDYLAGHFGEHQHPHSPEQLDLLPATPSARTEHCASPSIHSNRAVEQAAASAVCSGERRQKRMIKNRESAGRSRARKQAYTKELELEIAQLAQENAALKKEHEELKTAMASQVLSKGKFKRGSSA